MPNIFLSLHVVFIQTSSSENVVGTETQPPFVPGTNSTAVNLTDAALAEHRVESLEQRVSNQSGIIRQLLRRQEEQSMEISELQNKVDLLEDQSLYILYIYIHLLCNNGIQKSVFLNVCLNTI